MGKEIERKYLVSDNSFKCVASESHRMTQGYLSHTPESTVRIRIVDQMKGFVTIKGITIGASRGEWEYEIPVNDAVEMLALCPDEHLIDKIRHIVYHDGKRWEIDEFIRPCPGLVLAEIELTHEDDKFTIPPFVGVEVTGNPKYYNSNLTSISR